MENVSKALRGKGIGRSLMGALKHWAKAAGVSEVRIEVMDFNREAKRFYDAIGYGESSQIRRKTIA